MICFSNPGEIDIEAVTVLGASVKQGASPIGYFGTGLKYAIAVLLREGCSIEIWSGEKRYCFVAKQKVIRGEPFQLVYILGGAFSPRQLGFTTDFGRNWKLEHIYRELWSNAKDEQGRVEEHQDDALLTGMAGMTYIVVRGEAFVETHRQRDKFILSPQKKLVGKTEELEIYEGESDVAFYRGIAALKLEKPSLFTYNITRQLVLTEDRTISGGSFWLDLLVKDWTKSQADEAQVLRVVTAPEGTYDQTLYFDSGRAFSPAFETTVRKVVHENAPLNPTVGELFFSKNPKEELRYHEVKLSQEEANELANAIRRLAAWGFDYERYNFFVKVVETIGSGTIARVNGKRECVLGRKALADPDLLDQALVEEFIHLRDEVNDNSRAMQNVLFREIIRLGRKVNNEGYARGEALPQADNHYSFCPFCSNGTFLYEQGTVCCANCGASAPTEAMLEINDEKGGL